MGKYYEPNPPYYKEKPTKMASMRRIKIFGLLVFIAVVSLLFYTSSVRQQRNVAAGTGGDFYAKTMKGLGKQEVAEAGAGTGGKNDDDEKVAKQMAQRLKDAADKAKDNANAKAFKPDPPSQVVGKGNAAEGQGERSVAGRKKIGGDKAQEVVKEKEKDEEEEKEDVEVTTELNSILKKSPIIIFSKSYCPHSKRAKNILLEKYSIDPLPFVVELDQHPLGAKLQARLAKLTGRTTVPNVLINGVSIGGGDDVAELHAKKNLEQKVKDLGGKKIKDVKAL
ncbi:9166060d-a8ad-4de5-8573-e5329f999a69 [Sclerotinia trifoliorum]|uniref:9166060d-a8ad-4de5-8573-e5329f999a69 n=1 Tax=Sclerotinia trifoliorum TaxID=28548 RepID=A0A8H2W0B2_9HELO|nr:9166060d-a8ad-4de5-8573-e5329f999a69 [Sclerotinia trifoliorum]